MGDSDDDHHDRHSRDKFKRERNDYSFKRSGDWNDSQASTNWMSAGDRYTNRNSGGGGRDSFGRDQKPNGGNYGGPRNRYNDMSPPMKRFRNNQREMWNDREYGPGDRSFNRHSYNNNSHDQAAYDGGRSSEEGPTQPLMLSFKQFMNNLDDSIGHIEATLKYNNYKTDFKKKQLTEFFNAHKEEEWFRLKYHPEESIKRKKKLREFLVTRRECFIDLMRTGQIDSIRLDIDKTDSIVRLLDIVIIRLEGGDENDIRALDETPSEERSKEPELDLFSVDADYNFKKETKLSLNSSVTVNNGNTENSNVVAVNAERTSDESDAVMKENDDCDNREDNEDEETMKNSEEEEIKLKRKRKLIHKTSSIFLRQLPANITIEQIEQMFKKYPEFLRIAISEPQINKKFQRKAWVSFERTFDVRDIYLSLNNVKIRDVEIGAIINKDLTRRVRTINGIAAHKNCAVADIRHAAKIVAQLDHQKKIWQKIDDEDSEPTIVSEPLKLFGVESRNPLLRNITEFLIEEASAEEEELLGADLSQVDGDDQVLDRNEHTIKVLDRLIYYLRIVHSFDFYNACEYPNEDEMPNRLGLIHVRALPPSKIQQKDVDNYIQTFEQKITPFTQPVVELAEDELVKLGLRDEESEVEKFINENTQEISSEKWLCVLSGKKFKGPDFIRKHLLNKHVERLDEVRQEANYFNNYIRDVKRIQLPEHPANRPPSASVTQPQQHQSNVNRDNWNSSASTPQEPPVTSPFQMRTSRLVAQPARLLARRDPREIIGYNDLDDKLEMI